MTMKLLKKNDIHEPKKYSIAYKVLNDITFVMLNTLTFLKNLKII